MALAHEIDEGALRRLAEQGLIREDAGALRATRRWQSAMARAAFRLYGSGEGDGDLRLPIAIACLDLLGADLPDEELASLVEVMLPIEAAELDPREHVERARR